MFKPDKPGGELKQYLVVYIEGGDRFWKDEKAGLYHAINPPSRKELAGVLGISQGLIVDVVEFKEIKRLN